MHSVDRDFPQADVAPHGAYRTRPDRAAQAWDGPVAARGRRGGRAAMNLNPAISRDLLLVLLPELVLTGWALGLLLFVAWRHRTVRDLRITGWLTLLALVSTAVAIWWLWWNRAGVRGVGSMIAADDFRWVADWVFVGAA